MKKTVLIVLALIVGAKIFAQEWTYSIETDTSSDTITWSCKEAVELTDGRIAVSGSVHFRSGVGDFYTDHAAAVMLSGDGALLAQNDFFRPGYWGSTSPFMLQNGNGDLFALMSYSPDHDSTYFNYFLNYDNPPTDAVIALYKLDENMNVMESYEHSYPIDTFENHADVWWNWMPQEHSGSIFIYSAFVDEDNIVGVYDKSSTYCPSASRDHDSIFFFRMDFQGNFLDRKGYECSCSGGAPHLAFRRHHMVKCETGYLYFVQGSGVLLGYGANSNRQATVFYLDEHFNILRLKQLKHYNVIPGYSDNTFYNISVSRSHRNTTYLATSARSKDNPSRDEDCRLYEYGDGDNDINPLNHVDRFTAEWDIPAINKAVEVAYDGTVFFAYSLNVGFENDLDSWMMIECLNTDLDTLTTLYYDLAVPNERIHSEASAISTTKDGGVLLVFGSNELEDDSHVYSSVTKFPTEAFDGIEEAHDNGLKVAVAYPNPGGNTLHIRTGLRNAHLEVYDITGRLLHEQDITHDITIIDATTWPSGIYLWKLIANDTVAEIGKWVKE